MSWKYLAFFVGVTVLLYLYGGSASGNYGLLIGWVIISLVVYWFSLTLHPRRDCWYCRGSGRHRAMIFAYARRKCEHCDGNGWQLRWGARMRKIEG